MAIAQTSLVDITTGLNLTQIHPYSSSSKPDFEVIVGWHNGNK